MTPEELFSKYSAEVEKQGILLNPDNEFTMDLIRGILTNRDRYGEDYCPCRLVSGDVEIDRDIICPCVYRDSDIDDFGQCFCALFVNQEWVDGGEEKQILDQWQPDERIAAREEMELSQGADKEHDHNHVKMTIDGVTVWWCTVCGYLAMRKKAPGTCPICGAKRDRFKEVILAKLD